MYYKNVIENKSSQKLKINNELNLIHETKINYNETNLTENVKSLLEQSQKIINMKLYVMEKQRRKSTVNFLNFSWKIWFFKKHLL